MTATGHSDLDPEQQQFYEDKFGERYVGVQWQPGTMTRAERRDRKFRPKSERPLSQRRRKR